VAVDPPPTKFKTVLNLKTAEVLGLRANTARHRPQDDRVNVLLVCTAYVAVWPTTSDIAAQTNVSFQVNCGSRWRALERSKMTQSRRAGRAGEDQPYITLLSTCRRVQVAEGVAGEYSYHRIWSVSFTKTTQSPNVLCSSTQT
jgi:hypothetical protein